MTGHWGEGSPGSNSYFSHSVDPEHNRHRSHRQQDLVTPCELARRDQIALENNVRRWKARMAEAATNGPVLRAMRRWLDGDPVPTFQEQLDTFGLGYAHHMYAYFRGLPVQRWRNDREDFSAILAEREAFVREFGFATPNKEALDVLAAHQPLLEIGAGSGSWARLLQIRGVDIVATDAMLEQFGHGHGTHFPVIQMAGKAAVRRWPNRDVFCSWPSVSETWLRQAARAMRPGRYLLVVRESACADERTWDYIESAFEPIDNLELVNWQAMHDRLEVWRKLGPKQRIEQAAKFERVTEEWRTRLSNEDSKDS